MAIDVAAQYHKELMRTDSTIRFVVRNGIRCSATALSVVHRGPPLDNHAPEKCGQERPQAPESCSEMALFGVGSERKGAGKLGPSCEALTMEKKFAASLAERTAFEPEVAIGLVGWRLSAIGHFGTE